MYEEATGLLTAKKYADGKQTGYSYTPEGKLKKRTWARLGGSVFTEYEYYPATGELKKTDYSDTTPDILFEYDFLGRPKKITDAVGTHAFAYNAKLQPESETVTGIYDHVITRKYDAKGRSAGFDLGSDYSVTYGYDSTTGRFGSVEYNAAQKTGIVNYSYVPKSDLVSSAENGGFRTDYAYEAHRNLKTQVRNSQNSSSIISRYDYKYDELGRRTSVVNTGNAFAQSAFNKFGYNDRSELTASERFRGENIADVSLPVDPEKRLYAHDPIGNRRTATEETAVTTYTSNSLNQYTALSGAKTAAPLHDDDGNVTDYKNSKYSWNAENQMIAAEPKNPSEGDKKTEYLYDYMGRRARKQIFVYSSGTWTLTTEKLFVYDGWNLIKEVTKTGVSSSDKYYVWGLDLSQSLQGAGGIGGLICAVHAGEVRHFFYDANGNVGQVVNADGSIAAHYEYDPFGNIVNGVPQSDDNPFRFSTKYFDAETGLYYYGFRYYSAELGRWWSRDPLGEEGGIALYLMVGNNPVSLYDPFGLVPGGKKKPSCDEYKRRLVQLEEQIQLLRDIQAMRRDILDNYDYHYDKGKKYNWMTLYVNKLRDYKRIDWLTDVHDDVLKKFNKCLEGDICSQYCFIYTKRITYVGDTVSSGGVALSMVSAEGMLAPLIPVGLGIATAAQVVSISNGIASVLFCPGDYYDGSVPGVSAITSTLGTFLKKKWGIASSFVDSILTYYDK